MKNNFFPSPLNPKWESELGLGLPRVESVGPESVWISFCLKMIYGLGLSLDRGLNGMY